MTPEYKLQISIQLVEELVNVLEGNEYETFFSQHLIPVKIELARQLTNLELNSKIEE